MSMLRSSSPSAWIKLQLASHEHSAAVCDALVQFYAETPFTAVLEPSQGSGLTLHAHSAVLHKVFVTAQ